MAYSSKLRRSEVAHHAGEALSIDVTTAFDRLLTLLTALGAFQLVKQGLEFVDIKVVISGALASRYRSSHVNNA
jgi:hypothetical protein